MPTGTIGAPVRRASTATPSRPSSSAPSRCACPPGTRTARGPRRGSAGRAGRPRRPAVPRSTAWTPPLRAIQPTIGHAKSSFLPSQWNRRPSWASASSRATTASRFELWFDATITGPSRGISSTAPSSRTRVSPARPARVARGEHGHPGAISSTTGVTGVERSSLIVTVGPARRGPRRRGSPRRRRPRCPRTRCRRW